MSNATGTSGSDRPPSGRPYEVLAYGSLVIVFMIQMFEGSPLGVLVFACGLAVMIGKLQLGPIYYLVVLAGIQVAQYNQGVRPNNLFRPIFFGVNDVILCLCVVAFVASHYRLQGIWLHHLARDSRWLPAVKTRMQSFRLLRGQRLTPSDEGRRAPEQITQAEVSWLILSLPIWALLAQFMTQAIAQVRVPEIQPWLGRLLVMAWALGLGTFVVVHLLELWKRRAMSPAAAWLFLQDVLWRETRGEQRDMQRWLAWTKLRRR